MLTTSRTHVKIAPVIGVVGITLLAGFAADGMTLVMSTHNLGQAQRAVELDPSMAEDEARSLAGDLAAASRGQDGVIASDVMEQLPFATQLYRSRFPDLAHNHYGRLSVI